MIKDFSQWHDIKTEIQQRNPPSFREREIWWCHLGLNLGTETDGKNEDYLRPVLVLRKFNRRSLIALPLTTQIKDRTDYFRFHFHGRMQCAILQQIRKIDSLRLLNKMGELRQEPFDAIRLAVKELF
jgi:mRNA-degrading endonuclease toxin of MazEF toxin-antitoxin module